MTAVIGILNKTAVAVAADSAVTIGDNQKILNTANKLFTLSKFHPVGIVIYNSASFVSVPWEVLIKEYRRQRAMSAQDKLEGYANDFVCYVRSNVGLISPETRKESICASATKLFKAINSEVRTKLNTAVQQLPPAEQTMEKITALTAQYLPEVIRLKAIKYSTVNYPLIDDAELQAYPLPDFLSFYSEPLNKTWQQEMGGIQFTPDAKEAAFEVLYNYFKGESFDLSSWSGIGVIGYGDKEIYPSCYMLHFAEVVGDFVRVKKKGDESFQITDTQASAILPFAQRDVIQGFLDGVRPDLASVYYQVFGNLLSGVNAQLTAYQAQLVNTLPPGFSAPTMSLDVNQLVTNFAQLMQGVQQDKIIKPVLNSVVGLSKDDLAEMAESLIHLTYLHRRINSAPESVGGPIDVAVISKGDGFIWIKRKFYFRPEINPGFVQNYFTLRPGQP